MGFSKNKRKFKVKFTPSLCYVGTFLKEEIVKRSRYEKENTHHCSRSPALKGGFCRKTIFIVRWCACVKKIFSFCPRKLLLPPEVI
jgi:hypothetical protein